MADLLFTILKVSGALCFIAAPGVLATNALRGETKNQVYFLPISFGVVLILLSLCDIPLMFFQLNIRWLPLMWCLLSALFLWLNIHQDTLWSARSIRTILANWIASLKRLDSSTILDLINFLLLALLAICLFTGPGYLGGEEEIELISTRKILQNHYLSFFNIGHVPNLAPTYLLTPLYLFRAFLSLLTNIDPVLLHYRLGFLPPILAILCVAAIGQSLTRSHRFAQMMVCLGALCALLSPLVAYTPFILSGGSRFAPYLPAPNAFYRATCSIQIATPICLLFMLLAVTERARWSIYGALFLMMLLTTVQLHATAAVYIVEVLGLCLLAFALAERKRNVKNILCNAGVLRSAVLLGAACVILVAYKQCFNLVHQETESIYLHQRPFILENLMKCFHDPIRAFITFPADVFRFDYFKPRGVHYDWSPAMLFPLSGPPTLLAFICSYLYLLYKREFAPKFLFLIFLIFPFLLRLPILAIPPLLMNDLVFNDLVEHLSLICYLTLFLTGIVAANFLVERMRKSGSANPLKLFGLVLLTGVFSYFFLGDFAQVLKLSADRYNIDFLLTKFCLGATLVLAANYIFKRRLSTWQFSDYKLFPTLIIALALVLPVVLRSDYYYGHGKHTVLRSLPKQLKRLVHLQDDYERYTQNIWAKSELSRGLFDCLVFVRTSLPEQKVFAADPAVIRTVALLTNQYAAHSGVPFDFVEPYFLRYYKPTVARDDIMNPASLAEPYIKNDPFFQQDQPLSAQSLHADAEFVRDFKISYVLVTPKYYAVSKKLFAELERERLMKARKLFDKADYSVYQVADVSDSQD